MTKKLSSIINIWSHGRNQVIIGSKQRQRAGFHPSLPEKFSSVGFEARVKYSSRVEILEVFARG